MTCAQWGGASPESRRQRVPGNTAAPGTPPESSARVGPRTEYVPKVGGLALPPSAASCEIIAGRRGSPAAWRTPRSPGRGRLGEGPPLPARPEPHAPVPVCSLGEWWEYAGTGMRPLPLPPPGSPRGAKGLPPPAEALGPGASERVVPARGAGPVGGLIFGGVPDWPLAAHTSGAQRGGEGVGDGRAPFACVGPSEAPESPAPAVGVRRAVLP